MITLFCLIVYGKMPADVLGFERFLGLVILEAIVLYVVFK
jgi:hypothetical protein